MPIYEYKCQDCGAKFEALRSIKEADANIQCEKCSSLNSKRLISACFSQVKGAVTSSSGGGGGCGGCSGGSCATCGH